jgi:two-component system, NtrC family, sensor kinase
LVRAVHRLTEFSVDDLVACSEAFRGLRDDASTMEEAAQAITSYLHQGLLDDDGRSACPLVRLYKTHRLGMLPADLQDFAHEAAPDQTLDDEIRCLTLLATSGDDAGWNDRRHSAGHRAIPLVSAELVAQLPMVSGLIEQLGVDVATVVEPGEEGLALHHRDYDLFFVPEAEGSPMVPAQHGFVRPFGIRSVVGCGGMLPSRDLFALILFTRVALDAATADLFRTLALSVKATIVPFTFDVFAG